jgi:hypothetical protein
MDSNVVSIDTAGCETTTTGGSSVPEPATTGLSGLGLLLSLIVYRRLVRLKPSYIDGRRLTRINGDLKTNFSRAERYSAASC